MKEFYSTEDVYEAIKKDILDLKLYPGQLISENEMAEKFNVSRTVIRAAFAKLKIEKLVVVYPQRGTAISLIDLKYVGDLLYLRAAIERQVCLDVMEKYDTKMIKQLEENLKKQAKIHDYNTYDTECRELDEEFHRLLFRAVGREGIWEMVNSNSIHFQRYRNLDINLAKRFKQLIEEHHAIYKAVTEKDSEAINKLVHKHMFYSLENMYREVIEQYPQYFVNIN